MGWRARAAGTGVLVAAVCAVPGTVAGLASAAGPAGAAGAPGSPSTTSAVDEAPVDAQVRTRREFGLAADPAYVAGLQGRADAPYGSLAIPMTGAEEAEMARRGELTRHLSAVEGLLRRQVPATFAGAWVDQAAGGRAVVATTAPLPARLSRAISVLLPPGAPVELRVVGSSADELAAVRRRVESDGAWWAAQHLELVGVATSLPGNAVRVEVGRGTAPAAVGRILDRYGRDGLEVVVTGGS